MTASKETSGLSSLRSLVVDARKPDDVHLFMQARTDEKANIQKSLIDILHDLEVTRGAKEAQLSACRTEYAHVNKDVAAVASPNILQIFRLKFSGLRSRSSWRSWKLSSTSLSAMGSRTSSN